METTTPEALDFFNQAEKTFINLYFRWRDEHEYEDIKDYQLPLNSIATKCGVSITKMNKRPFGCDFSVAGKNFTIKVTSRSYSYSSKK